MLVAPLGGTSRTATRCISAMFLVLMTPTRGLMACKESGGRVAFSTKRKLSCLLSGDQVTLWIKPFTFVSCRGAEALPDSFGDTSARKTCCWPGVAQSDANA